jgi:effector-binding domain-containing protein
VDEPRIDEREAVPYVGIRREVTDGVPAMVDRAFPELFGWLGERGLAPAAAPFIRVHEVGDDGEPLDMEVCVPVAGEVEAADPVRAAELPAGRYLTVVHTGPFNHATETDINDTRAELLRWANERGIAYSRESERGRELPGCVDHLWNGPAQTPDHSAWQTELAYLVIDEPA